MRRRDKKRTLALFIICLVLFLAAVGGVFFWQSKLLNEKFDQLVLESLASYTQSQGSQARSLVTDLQNRLASIAALIETSDLPPEGEWLDVFLLEVSTRSDTYTIDYLTAESMAVGLISDATEAPDLRVLSQLMDGRGVVSDIRYSERLGGFFVFSVAEPVFRKGQIIGALRSRLNATTLTNVSYDGALLQNIRSVVVNAGGDVLFEGVEQPASANLFEGMRSHGIDARLIDEIERHFRYSDTAVGRFHGKGAGFFLASEPVGYNGWHIVNFVLAQDVLLHTNLILGTVVSTGITLILLTTALSIAVTGVLLRRKQQLSVEMRRYAVLSRFSDTVLFEYHAGTDTLEFTPNARTLLSLPNLRIKGVTDEAVAMPLLHPDDREGLRCAFGSAAADDEQLHETQLRLQDKGGAYRWFGCQYKYLSGGKDKLVVGKLVDITDQRGREAQLLDQARRDVLTDAYNRAGEQIIEDKIARGERGLLFMMDVDSFKQINDAYGHTAGDELLVKVGAALKETFRAGDIVARVGGDEFVIFIAGVDEAGIARQKARALQQRIGQIRLEEHPHVAFSVSIGIAACPRHGDTYAQLYAAADRAMYTAKRRGKRQFALFDGR